MEKIFSILKNCSLFDSIQEEDFPAILDYLGGTAKHYRSGDIVLLTGEKTARLGIVLNGQAQIIKEDSLGNRSIVAQISPAEVFAEAVACAAAPSPVTVVATADCQIFFLPVNPLFAVKEAVPVFCAKLVANLLKVLAGKNIELNRKIDYLSLRTTREKLLEYLSAQHKRAGGNPFTIPFDREQLAEYLCVDRSAMSRELGRLKKEGILDFKKNAFSFT